MHVETALLKCSAEPPPLTGTSPAPTTNNDPDEVDLSTHPSASRTPNNAGNNAAPTEADIRALLRSGGPQPSSDRAPHDRVEEDPMMKLLSQMMGGMPGGEGQEGEAGLPPGIAAMLGAGGLPGLGGPGQQEDKNGLFWKIIHAVFALVLGVYVTATSSAFSGQITRGATTGNTIDHHAINVFWAFTTAELILQSSRYFLERGRSGSQMGGWMGIAGGFLPEPWRGWVMLIARYSGIWSTVVEDAMVIVFIVGCVSWWKGDDQQTGHIQY